MLCPERSAAHGKARHLGGARVCAPQPVTPCVSTMKETGLDSHAPTNITTDTLPCTGLQAQLHVAYHLVLNGMGHVRRRRLVGIAAYIGVLCVSPSQGPVHFFKESRR